MFFDPLYLIIMVPGLLLSLWASWRTKSSFKKYSQVRSARGMTGAQAADRLLAGAGIDDVEIVPTSGFLSDYYNPVTKKLTLSEGVFQSTSVAALGIACHEPGHARFNTPVTTLPCGRARLWSPPLTSDPRSGTSACS